MDLKLNGRLALVTGSSTGIGKEIAKRLLLEGTIVIINGRNPDRLEKTRQELSQFGTCLAAPGDVGTMKGVQEIFSVTDRQGPLDILVCNAGYYKGTPFENITDNDWTDMINVNLMSMVRMTRHYLPLMLKNDTGRIVLISSESGIKPAPEMIHYSVTKTAIIGLGRGLAELTKGTRVAVNTVLPGLTLTENSMTYQVNRAKQEGIEVEDAIHKYFTSYEPSHLLQRPTTEEEIANTVVYFCSELSAATNGSAIRAEGGIIRHI